MMKGKLIRSINRISVTCLLYLIYLRTIYAELEPKEENSEAKLEPVSVNVCEVMSMNFFVF